MAKTGTSRGQQPGTFSWPQTTVISHTVKIFGERDYDPLLASRIHRDRAPDHHWRPRPRADLDLLLGAQLDRENRDAQFTRLTDAYSRKVKKQAAGISLHFMFYDFAGPHDPLQAAGTP